MGAQPRRSSRTLLWGLTFGILLALFIVAGRLFDGPLARSVGLSASHPLLALLSPAILFIVGLACFFFAGVLATHRTRSLSSGLIAGMIAGAIAAVVALIIALHAASATEALLRHTTIAPRLRAVLRASVAQARVRAVLAAIATMFVGAGAGALGGLAGRGARGSAPTGPDARPYATGNISTEDPDIISAPGYAPAAPWSAGEQRNGPATPQTYIQGNDNPTVQTLRQE
jgi:hypothetical protein